MWHSDERIRKKIGDGAEDLFEAQVRCYCGGKFQFIGDQRIGFPDFTCEYCGQLVDVKSSPQAEKTGNIAVSEIPFSKYSDNTLVVVNIKGEWLGEYKGYIKVKNKNPYSPTRHSPGKFKNTRYHLITWKNFRRLDAIGQYEFPDSGNHYTITK